MLKNPILKSLYMFQKEKKMTYDPLGKKKVISNFTQKKKKKSQRLKSKLHHPNDLPHHVQIDATPFLIKASFLH